MSLLELDRVSKCYGNGSRQKVALRDVSLQIDAGERVAVYGSRRTGRTTLLRVAAGLEEPDSGVVRFAGQDLAGKTGDLLGAGIGFCTTFFCPTEGRTVLDQMVIGQFAARRVSAAIAHSCSHDALTRCEVAHCAALEPDELDGAEAARVSIAKVLISNPELLVIDEPTIGVDPLERDGVLLLLQALSREGVAILMSTGDSTDLSGADRALIVDDGRLRGHLGPERAQVIPLCRPERRTASA